MKRFEQQRRNWARQWNAAFDAGYKTGTKPHTENTTITESIHRKGPEEKGNSKDEDDDELDNVALFELGEAAPPKRRNVSTITVDVECVARILHFASKRWGHMYREPNDVDYAWRWELFHGQNGTSEWDTSAKNPRRALSMENARFVLDEKVFENLRVDGEPQTQEQTEATVLVSVLLDQARSGLVDELLALQRSGVVRIDSYGVFRLSSTWFTNVDVLLLEEMIACWSKEMDPRGKYGVHETLRTLSTKWIRYEEGWALTSSPNDIIYEPDEFAVWRAAFETKHEEKVDDLHGVGRFGL